MPQPRSTRTARPGRNGNVPTGDINEAEAAAIRAQVARREQAPSSQAQTFVDWRKLADQLGQPFEVERIPLSKLRAMSRDPMLAFGLAFIETPHHSAEWGIEASDSNGPNAQVAGNVDYALRRIWTSFVSQFFLATRFGSVALAKRFEERIPAGTYIETDPNTGENTEQPLWSEGGIQPILWKPFVSLPPETVEPIWDGNGDFAGIDYTPPQGASAPGGAGASSNGKDGFKIPLSHSLWITNEREAAYGNMYGYSRLGYAYRYWWSYWFRWAIADRAFEKKGDPSVVVRYPDGQSYDPITQTKRENADIAMELGERIRSGGVITMPSEVWMGEISGAPSAQPQWTIETLTDLIDFNPFDASFEYLDIMKLRALWVPEQAFLEGKGGTSSRNVAATNVDSFMQQQEMMSNQLVETANRWIIPQFIAINFPEFVAAGGSAKLVMKGFAQRDVDAMKAVVQLVAQQERGSRELASVVDLRETAKALGLPLRSMAEQTRIEGEMKSEADAAAKAAAAPPVAPAGSGLSAVPTATGFSYMVTPDETIVLFSDDAAAFERDLKESGVPAFADAAVRSAARELWSVWRVAYRDEYNGFADWLAKQDGLEAAEPGSDHWNRARKIVNDWNKRANVLKVINRSSDILKRIVTRAGDIARTQSGGEMMFSDAQRDAWITSQVADATSSAFSTNEEELTRFLANQFEAGETDVKVIAAKARTHFAEFPDWKADRTTRASVRNAFNEGVVLSQEVNKGTVLAMDAMLGDTDEHCKERDGEIMTPDQARAQTEHPYGTLSFRALPINFSVVEEPESEQTRCRYDSALKVVYFEGEVPAQIKREYTKAVVERL